MLVPADALERCRAVAAQRTDPLARMTLTSSLPPGRAAVPAPLAVRDLGLIPYAEAAALQDALAAARLEDQIPDTLMLLEHPPVVTLGRRATLDHVYLSEPELARKGVELHRSTRGGLVTYHGPGQLVGYPIVKLRARGLTIPCYVRALEKAIIMVLADLGVEACIDPDNVGVWTHAGKIAAIGVHQRHGVTLHGFAVNLQPDLSHFTLINPCGIADKGVTSAAALLGHPIPVDAVKARIPTALEASLAEVACA
ncbi:MAG: lipoyl(octanoyl) transferase LipB [Chloroflexota bacterium]